MRLVGIEKLLKRLSISLCFTVLGVNNVAADGHRTVIVSLDGCRWDYPLMYDTPNIDRIGEEGVSGVMQPSFPSLTFPNHYTLATGLVPDHHGIIGNTFYDKESGLTFSLGDERAKKNPRFYGGEPIWITAKKQGKVTGVVYWAGADVAIQGMYPDYYFDYEKKPLLTYVERIAEVERMLAMPEDKRPQLIMVYFDEPDYSGHMYGPESKRTRKAMEVLDCLIGQLWMDIKSMPGAEDVNLIVTSDHGMARDSRERIIHVEDYLERDWYEKVTYGFPAMIAPVRGREKKILNALRDVPHLRAYKKRDVPGYLNYGSNKNVDDIVVFTDIGFMMCENDSVMNGSHGFDPTYGDMHVIFRAAGPDFKKGYVKEKVFKNVDVYPLLNRLLGTRPAPCDGCIDNVVDLLK